VLNVRIENCTGQLSALESRTGQLEESIKKGREELKKLEEEQKDAVRKEKKIDFESLKQRLFENVKKISELTNTISKLNSSVIENIKQRKNVALSYIKEGKAKESINELDAIVSILETESKKHEALANEISALKKKVDELLGVKIGEEAEARNILLEITLKKQDLERMELIIKRNAKEKIDLENSLIQFKDEFKEKEKEGKEKEKQEKEIYGNFQKLFAKRNSISEKLRQTEGEMMNKQNSAARAEDEANVLKVARAKIDAELETLNMRMKEFEGVGIVEASRSELEARIARNEEALSKIGGVNMRALEVYESVKGEYDKIAEKAAKLEAEKQEILKIIDEIDRKKKSSFMKALNSINFLFSENFSKLSGKGQAWLEIEDKGNIFSGGLDIIVKIAKGKYMDISSLSGGEQVLAALSLIFAIQEYKPYCFYILDEIDAALDKRNSERIAGLLNSHIKMAQYIIISHNDAIISGATILYGVSMQDGISKVVSLKV
jgi:chromosome segregation protein